MYVSDKNQLKEKENFFDRLRKEVQNELYEHILSNENERRRKLNQAEVSYFEDHRTPEQIKKDIIKKKKAVKTAIKQTNKVFKKETKWAKEI